MAFFVILPLEISQGYLQVLTHLYQDFLVKKKRASQVTP